MYSVVLRCRLLNGISRQAVKFNVIKSDRNRLNNFLLSFLSRLSL